MSSFAEEFAHIQPPTAEEEAAFRARNPEAFTEEEGKAPEAEDLAENDFRYDENGVGLHHRNLSVRERTRLNEDHLSAQGRAAVMARMAAELDNNNANEPPAAEERAATTTTTTTNNNNSNNTRKQLSNPITVNAMREGVVDEEVYSRYVNEIIHFISWLHDNKEDLLTEHSKTLYRETNIVLVEGEKPRERQKRIKSVWLAAVKASSTTALIDMEKLTPEVVMEFVSCQANQRSGKRLSQAGYNGKRSAVQHLVRCQQGHFWSGEFEQRMKVLWKGFSRLTTNERKKSQPRQRKRRHPGNGRGEEAVADRTVNNNDNNNDSSDSETEGEEEEDDRFYFLEGKSPMTTELYQSLCRWFMEWGSTEGIFATCFLVFTWHLACRSNNTGKIKTSHLQWTYHDALHVRFRHTKTQKHGEARRHKRACYSNPFRAEIDLPFVLGLYLSTCFNTQQKRGSRLFPGGHKSQSSRMGNLLRKALQEHQAEVLAMGYDTIEEIGLHSIRKGVSTYLASLPGGPPPAALCLRAGWSMGQVKDIYFHQTDGGDEFVGRCASLLNMANGEFAIAPPCFDAETDEVKVDEAIKENFPHFESADGMKRILNRCLASLLHHRDYVIMNLPPNHIARSIPLYRQSGTYNDLKNHVNVLHSWETAETLSGIPPHIKSLVDIATIKQQQEVIVEQVYGRVMEGIKAYFEEIAIGGGQLTEGRIQTMIKDSMASQFTDLKKALERLTVPPPSRARQHPVDETNEATVDEAIVEERERAAAREVEKYPLRVRNGMISRLPNTFEFPKAGVYDLWTKWNIGDTEVGVPPLRLMKAPDFAFLDAKPPLPEQQFKRKAQAGPARRRPSRKIFSDMKFVCSYIETKATEGGMDINDRRSQNVRLMYEKIEGVLYETVKAKRGTQLKWRTLLHKLRKAVRQKENG